MEVIKKRATITRWGLRQFGFAREDNGTEWFIHGHDIIGGTRNLCPGTIIEFEPHPHPKNDGLAPLAIMVRVIEVAQ